MNLKGMKRLRATVLCVPVKVVSHGRTLTLNFGTRLGRLLMEAERRLKSAAFVPWTAFGREDQPGFNLNSG